MDPFSAEGELINIHNAFFQGQYSKVIEQDLSSLSSSNTVAAKTFVYRARIALGEAEDVHAELEGDDTPEYAAVRALALSKAGDEDTAVEEIETLAENYSDNATVQVIGGGILIGAGKMDEALSLLSRHQGNLEAVALIVQLRLAQNRTDLAVKEVQQAKRWAQDSLLVNLAEAWVGLRVGGDKYQQSYYVFEELAQAPSTSSTKSLVGQAVSEIHLGRLPEAEVALQQALDKHSNEPDALANYIVLSILNSQNPQKYQDALQQNAPTHAFLTDLEEKSELFDKAATKYATKIKA